MNVSNEVSLELILDQLRFNTPSYHDNAHIGVHSVDGKILLHPADELPSPFACLIHARPGAAIKARTQAVDALLSDSTRAPGISVVQNLKSHLTSRDHTAVILREESELLLWSAEVDKVVEEFIALDHRLRHRASLCDCDSSIRPTEAPRAIDTLLSISQHVPVDDEYFNNLSIELPELEYPLQIVCEPDSCADQSLLIDGVMKPLSFQIHDDPDSLSAGSSYGITPAMIVDAALSPWRRSSSMSPMDSTSLSSGNLAPRTISPSLLHSPRYTPLSMLTPLTEYAEPADPTPFEASKVHDVRIDPPQLETRLDPDDISAQCPCASSRQNSPAPSHIVTPSVSHSIPRASPSPSRPRSLPPATSQPLITPEGPAVRRKRKRSLPPQQSTSDTTTRVLRSLPSRQSRSVDAWSHIPEAARPTSARDMDDDSSELTELTDSDMDADGIDDDEYVPMLNNDGADPDDEHVPEDKPKSKRRRKDEEEQQGTRSGNRDPSWKPPCAKRPMRGTKAPSRRKGKHVCTWCRERFTRKWDLNRHLGLQAEEPSKLQCPCCNRIFSRSDARKRHVDSKVCTSKPQEEAESDRE